MKKFQTCRCIYNSYKWISPKIVPVYTGLRVAVRIIKILYTAPFVQVIQRIPVKAIYIPGIAPGIIRPVILTAS